MQQYVEVGSPRLKNGYAAKAKPVPVKWTAAQDVEFRREQDAGGQN
jgi:hypothetical protein